MLFLLYAATFLFCWSFSRNPFFASFAGNSDQCCSFLLGFRFPLGGSGSRRSRSFRPREIFFKKSEAPKRLKSSGRFIHRSRKSRRCCLPPLLPGFDRIPPPSRLGRDLSFRFRKYLPVSTGHATLSQAYLANI